MPLTPEEIEDHRFREVLRGYDRGQVEAFLAQLAAGRRPAGPPDGSENRAEHRAEDGAEGPPADPGAPPRFDDALRGYDKEEVAAFLEAVAADPPLAGAGAPAPVAAGTDPGGGTQAADPPQDAAGAAAASLASEEAARALIEAWRERDAAVAARAAAEDSWTEALAARTEAARMAEMAAAELDAAQLLQAQARADAAVAADERAAASAARSDAVARLAGVVAERAMVASLRSEARRAALEAADALAEAISHLEAVRTRGVGEIEGGRPGSCTDGTDLSLVRAAEARVRAAVDGLVGARRGAGQRTPAGRDSA